MLKKNQRITEDKDFQTIYRRGRHYSNAFFSLNFLINNYGHPRVGIVVNKKVAKKAVDRNLLKRRIREIVRSLYNQLPLDKDVIISTRPKAKDLDFEAIKKEIKSLLVIANLLK